jgi:alpha-tubulin suppressor-like RCC1 family protein
MSIVDLGNIRFNWRGAYTIGVNYVKDDVVSYKGSSYVALRNVLSITPVVGLDWDLMAAGTDQLLQEGDLLTHDGSVPVRLARGANGQILQMINNRPAWRDQSMDPSRRVWKLAKVNGMGGYQTRVYLMTDGTIKACGYGGNGSNGDVNSVSTYFPSRVPTEDPDVRFVNVYSGGMQHYGVTANGEVWSWGFNNYGQLGHGDTANRGIAKRIEYFVTNNIQIAKVIPGRPNYYDYGTALFLTTDGKLYGCGFNESGNLGNGTGTNAYTPVRCGSLTNIVQVALSGLPYTVMAVDASGGLWVWGYNAQGQLGLGDTTNRLTPILHPLTNVVKAATAGGYNTAGAQPNGHSLVLRSDGTIWGAGYNGFGQLGLGDTTNRTSFAQISSSAFFSDIFTGDGRYPSGGAITNAGDLWVWGYNAYAQLGINNTTNQLSPVKPPGGFQGQVTRGVFGGSTNYEACIIQAGNAIYAAGYNGAGNIGLGANTSPGLLFKLGHNGTIQDWNCYGTGQTLWGLGILYNDGRVDTCGCNSQGETGARVTTGDVTTLKNVLF